MDPYTYKENIEPSPNLLEHSLIQKAVRRGNVDLVEEVFRYLLNIDGQSTWLKNRLAVIGYEECWPYADTINFNCSKYQLLKQYKAFACKVKNKDCDGLAYLANKINQYETTALRGDQKQREGIERVAAAMKDDVGFWKWIEMQPLYPKHKKRINAARASTKRSWKNRAIMYAAAYLSVTYPIPPVVDIEPNNNPDFQYWTVIDKHTIEGKEIIHKACDKINLLPKRGEFLTFYFAGALCNRVQPMPFFELMKEYKIERMGYKYDEAKKIWLQLRPQIIEMCKPEVERMLKSLNNIKKHSNQLELFDC